MRILSLLFALSIDLKNYHVVEEVLCGVLETFRVERDFFFLFFFYFNPFSVPTSLC